jgi:hypothetical protein
MEGRQRAGLFLRNNPGRLVCASFGALIWSVVDTILIFRALNNYTDG